MNTLAAVRHLKEQGPVVAALGRTVLSAARQRIRPSGPPTLPGPVHEAVVPPRPRALIADYLRWAGGDPDRSPGTVPAHLFPQWGFPILGEALRGVPYPMARALNAGCRMELRSPIPAGEPLHLRAHLEGVDDDGRRVILHQRLVTSAPRDVVRLVCDVQIYVPLRRGGASKGRAKVPPSARALTRWRAPLTEGLAFACLTGDLNPVHWLWPYARLAGFPSTILHGFGSLARAAAALEARSGRPPAMLDVRFTRPLVLPREVGVYVDDGRLWVADAPETVPYLEGRFEDPAR